MGSQSEIVNDLAEQHPLWILFLVLRIPVFIIIGYTIVIFDTVIPDATFETIRYTITDRRDLLLIDFVLLCIASFTIRAWSDVLARTVAPSLLVQRGVTRILVLSIPRTLAMAPGLLLGLRYLQIAVDPGSFADDVTSPLRLAQQLPDTQTPLNDLAWATAAGLSYVCTGVFFGTLRDSSTRTDPDYAASIFQRLRLVPLPTQIYLALSTIFSVAALILLSNWRDVSLAQAVGPVGILLLWSWAACAYFAPIATLSHILRMPLLLMLTALALFASALNLNDNHNARMVNLETPHPVGHHYFEDEIDLYNWLEARKSIDLRDYNHYPIYIIATEGGALRSAYFTHRILDTLQTICPTFMLHTLGISGVSGGSVGAAGFIALNLNKATPVNKGADQGPPLPECDDSEELKNRANNFSRHAPTNLPGTDLPFDKLYSADLTSPLLSALLFPDALQRILPFKVPGFDRARYLECAFEIALKDADAKQTLFGTPCQDDFAPLSRLYSTRQYPTPTYNLVPHLFLNTTWVEAGVILPVTTAGVPFAYDFPQSGTRRAPFTILPGNSIPTVKISSLDVSPQTHAAQMLHAAFSAPWPSDSDRSVEAELLLMPSESDWTTKLSEVEPVTQFADRAKFYTTLPDATSELSISHIPDAKTLEASKYELNYAPAGTWSNECHSVQGMMLSTTSPEWTTGCNKHRDAPDLFSERDLSLSTAAFLSARFPFATPPARIGSSDSGIVHWVTQIRDSVFNPLPENTETNQNSTTQPESYRLVDGGVVENSGAWFARKIIETVNKAPLSLVFPAQESKRDPEVWHALLNAKITVIVISAEPCDSPRSSESDRAIICEPHLQVNSGLHELSSHLDSLINARKVHGEAAIASLKDVVDANRRHFRDIWTQCQNAKTTKKFSTWEKCGQLLAHLPIPVSVTRIALKNSKRVRVPMTWTLSRPSKRLLEMAAYDLYHYFLCMREIEDTDAAAAAKKCLNSEVTLNEQENFQDVVCEMILLRRDATAEYWNSQLVNQICGHFIKLNPWLAPDAGARTYKEVSPPADVPTTPQVPPPPPPPPSTDPKPPVPEIDICENCDLPRK